MDSNFINEKLEELLLSNPSVNEVVFGKKTVSGSLTEEDSFIFGVTAKKPLSELSEDEILPSTVLSGSSQIKTDVVEVEKIYTLGSEDFLSSMTDVSGSTITVAVRVFDLSGSLHVEITPAEPIDDLLFTEEEIDRISTIAVTTAQDRMLSDGESISITVEIPSECPDECYFYSPGGIYGSVYNRIRQRPLRGGLQIHTDNTLIGYGTMGFLAVDNSTGALVGVTNSHVVTEYAFRPSDYATYFNTTDFARFTNAFQNQRGNENDVIGPVIRYGPLKMTSSNKVDGALIGLQEADIDLDSSPFLFGYGEADIDSSYPIQRSNYREFPIGQITPMEFATTAEIDSIDSSTELAATGRTTGPKDGTCGLRAASTNTSLTVGGFYDGSRYISRAGWFVNCIKFTRINSNCPYPIAGGDSGSALLAKFGDTWKIVGLCFAGSTYTGYACRIDNVANILDISAWDGTAPAYINPNSMKSVTVEGSSDAATLQVGGEKYFNMGRTRHLGNQN